MKGAGFTSSRPSSGRMAEGRAKNPKREFVCTRADALFFRAQTLAIVRHFFEISCQIGRLPSILGREFFRAKVSHHRVPSFEEQVVFVHDIECALARLSPRDAEIISLVGLYQYSLEEVTRLLRRSRSTVSARFVEALDTFSEILLTTGLLRDDRPDRRIQRFDQSRPERTAPELPPKKPVASVSAEASCAAMGQSVKYSFLAHGQAG